MNSRSVPLCAARSVWKVVLCEKLRSTSFHTTHTPTLANSDQSFRFPCRRNLYRSSFGGCGEASTAMDEVILQNRESSGSGS